MDSACLRACLLLALLYPIVTVFIMWAVSGHVGPAEAVLGLKADIAGWRRGFAIALMGVSIVSIWRAHRTKEFKSVISFAFAVTSAFAFAFAVALALAGAVAVAGVVAVAVALVGAVAEAITVASVSALK
jgi:hypothetical protein